MGLPIHKGLLACLFVCAVLITGMVFACQSDDTPLPVSPARTEQVVPIPAAEQVPFRFIAMGDTGSGLKGQKQVASQLALQYAKLSFQVVLMLGDNIYPDGDTQKYGYTRFIQPYQPLLEKGIRFFPALGNHDIVGGLTRQSLAFFKMPGPYYDFVEGPVHLFALDTNQFDAKQREWLSHRLKTASEPWKIVYGHHPVYSSGMHGNTQTLIRELKPLLEMYHVDLYLAGHDHDYERFTPRNGVTYVVSGGGGASLRAFKKPQPGSQVRVSVHHFLRFEASKERLQLDALNASGDVIDTWQQNKTDDLKHLKPAA
jgi:acid phosphatase